MINGTNKLDTVKQAFRNWRATRTKRGKIPDELWEEIKKLLPLDNDELHFVELERKPSTCASALLSNKGNLCTLELYRPCGSILTMHYL